ncbi:MAG: hypothetical protein QXJ74_04170 [Nitrososphaera sp.]|uniref:hypothetical protein n=1 Tax=Nitrososphaera sp. TaxID=1971748 RepID=UPI0018345046|nr:hypothetical protein [Nitrososphaera sp.]NWG36901.1 hypothetical protein [Nitrososphaera sp.]
MSQSNNSTLLKVNEGINELCDKLKLTSFVRERCLEMSGKLEREGGAGLTGSTTNAVACSIVSVVHEEAHRRGRVPMHLPDKMIGKVFGLDGGDIARGKHIMNSRR